MSITPGSTGLFLFKQSLDEKQWMLSYTIFVGDDLIKVEVQDDVQTSIDNQENNCI